MSTTHHTEIVGSSVLRRVASVGSSIGLSVLGAGLLALAAVEAGLLVQHDALGAKTAPAQTVPAALPTNVQEQLEATPATGALATRSALGASVALEPQAAADRVIGIAADRTTTGVTLYRLLATGRIEASTLGNTNVWSEWVHVAPGLSGNSKPAKPKDEE